MRSKIRLLAGSIVVTALAQLAQAQSFPNKPMRLIVTFPPGGATDVIARGLSIPLTKSLGQPMVVDNRPGANGIIGMEVCARAAADGYTYCMTNNDAIVFNPVLYAKLPYDTSKDLIPIAKVGEIEQLIVAHQSVTGTTLKQVIDQSKSTLGSMTFSTFGNGSMGHLYIEWFNNNAGAAFVHVPYKGAGPALEAVFKGETKVSLFGVGAAMPFIRKGILKPLAFVDNRRSANLPDVPSLTELGFGFIARAWLGFFAPSGTPLDAARRINRDVGMALADPEFRKRFLADNAIEAAPNTMEQFAEFIRTDSAVAATQLRAAKIHLD